MKDLKKKFEKLLEKEYSLYSCTLSREEIEELLDALRIKESLKED